jgi:hypothetical protein
MIFVKNHETSNNCIHIFNINIMIKNNKKNQLICVT